MRTHPIRRALTAAALVAAAGAAGAHAEPIPWRSEAARAAAPVMTPAQAKQSLAELAARPGASHVIVQFATDLPADERAALERAGLRLLRPLTGGAYFASVRPDYDRTAVNGTTLRFASALTRDHKLHRDFAAKAPPAWSIVSDAREDGAIGSDPIVGAYVQFHEDVDAFSPQTAEMIGALGGQVRDLMSSVNALVVELPLSSIDALADKDGVQWVEPPLPRFEGFNASNRARVQADIAQAAPYNLDGSGVTVLVYDAGTARASHVDLSGRTNVIDSSGMHYHATHVAGTVAGDGSGNPTHTGMAPGASIISAGFEYDGSGTFLYTNPGDIEADYSTSINTHGAVISNNSIGSNVGPNGFPCSWEGDYGLTAATIDNIIRGSLGDSIVIFWSAGNERGWGCGTYGTSPPPTNNKNAITVGALNSNNDSMTSFSSWGPSDDGRLRPVLAGPGCQSDGDGGVTSADSGHDTDYTTLCGTSMSGPTLAGMGALIYEDVRNLFPSVGDPSCALMKVWLCHTCVDLGNTGPDYQYGYGSARVVDAIDFIRTGQWTEDTVDQGGVVSYTLDIAGGTPEFKVTMAWTDPAGAVNVSPSLVNDLDLVVISPSGVQHYPWTLNPASPASPAVRNAPDRLNNIEQVLVDNPEPGQWRVEVLGFAVPDGPQDFAICASPELGAGLLSLAVLTEVPDLQPPATPLPVEVQIFEGADTLVSGSVELHYRLDGGAFTTVAMTEGVGTYSGVIPGADCDETMEYYFTAEGDQAGTISVPSGGASGPFGVPIGEITVVLDDNFETDNGWTVSGTITTQGAGRWERGVPAGAGDRSDPSQDSDGSGQCWVTGNAAGNTDVDNGTTILTSPDYALASQPEAVISYDRWYDTSAGASSDDLFVVEISNNSGASWTTLENVGPDGSGGWVTASFRVADFVTPTDQVRLRFTASDLGTQNVVEAGVDAIHIESFGCDDGSEMCNEADLAEPFGQLDFSDVTAFLTAFGAMDPGADLAPPFGEWNFSDVVAFLSAFGAGCP